MSEDTTGVTCTTSSHLVDIGYEAWPLWTDVGFLHSLGSDAEIATFLLRCYKRMQGDSDLHSRCGCCHLPLICPHCNFSATESLPPHVNINPSVSVNLNNCNSVSTSESKKVLQKSERSKKNANKPRVNTHEIKLEDSDGLRQGSVDESENELAKQSSKGNESIDWKTTETSQESGQRHLKRITRSVGRVSSSLVTSTALTEVKNVQVRSNSETLPPLQIEEQQSSKRRRKRIVQTGGSNTQSEKQKQKLAKEARRSCVKICLKEDSTNAILSNNKKPTQTVPVDINVSDDDDDNDESSANMPDDDGDDDGAVDMTEDGHKQNAGDMNKIIHDCVVEGMQLVSGKLCSATLYHQAEMDRPTRSRISIACRSIKTNNSGDRSCQPCVPSSAKQGKQKRSADNRLQCPVCLGRFSRSDSLGVHMRTHSGFRPYVCEVCGSSFNRSYCLVAHKLTHSGDKPFRCTECDAAFKQAGKLTVHMRKHSGFRPFLCSLCGMSFTQSDSLKMHIRTHSRLKPYKCSECGKGFTHPHSVKVHSRIHTGQRPYKCDLCPLTFADPSLFRRHKAKHASTTARAVGEFESNLEAVGKSEPDSETVGVLESNSEANAVTRVSESCNVALTGVSSDGGSHNTPLCENKDLSDKESTCNYHSAFLDKESAHPSTLRRLPVSSRGTVSGAMDSAFAAQVFSLADIAASCAATVLPEAYDFINSAAFSPENFSAPSSMFVLPVSSSMIMPATSSPGDGTLTVPNLPGIRFHPVPISTSSVPHHVPVFTSSVPSLLVSSVNSAGRLTVPSVSRMGLQVPVSALGPVPVNSSATSDVSSENSDESSAAAMAADSLAFLNSALQGNFS